jgi:hypothetical protein
MKFGVKQPHNEYAFYICLIEEGNKIDLQDIEVANILEITKFGYKMLIKRQEYNSVFTHFGEHFFHNKKECKHLVSLLNKILRGDNMKMKDTVKVLNNANVLRAKNLTEDNLCNGYNYKVIQKDLKLPGPHAYNDTIIQCKTTKTLFFVREIDLKVKEKITTITTLDELRQFCDENDVGF